ncbi:MAG: MBL fold metallo-hydrolase [Elusimicrobiota bacterium]|jgi:metallo-beta-lactamase family protein|nr:MBL fold metallo-hydrolase [Elusimicrobiota bacterium]
MKKFIVLFIFLFYSLASAQISVTPLGAAGSISGSSFLIESGSKSVLIDCGLFYDNDGDNFTVAVKAANANALILTHAHLDHIGRVPLLIHSGFKGSIYSTTATKEFALESFRNGSGFELIKRKWAWSKENSKSKKAVLHWIDACIDNVKEVSKIDKEMTIAQARKQYALPFSLCNICLNIESENIEKMFVTVKYNESVKLFNNFSFHLIDAAHIPGSAGIFFNIEDKKIVFSGDLGSGYSRFTGKSAPADKADFVFMEGTNAKDFSANIADSSYQSFHNDLKKAADGGKLIWISALSFNRMQKVLYELKIMQDNSLISKQIDIYSISPTANRISRLYEKQISGGARDWFIEDVYKQKTILPQNLHFSYPKDFSKQMILLSASGDEKSTQRFIKRFKKRGSVLFMTVNYMDFQSAAAKLARDNDLKEAIEVKKYAVFSDHPDAFELLRWLSNQDKETKIYLIHYNEEEFKEISKFFASKGFEIRQTKISERIIIKQ